MTEPWIDNIRNRMGAARKSKDYNSRTHVDVPIHELSRLLDRAERYRKADALKALKLGDRVIETGVSAMTGKTGVVVASRSSPGDLAVLWDEEMDGGHMTTLITHGTRRIIDVCRAFRAMEDPND